MSGEIRYLLGQFRGIFSVLHHRFSQVRSGLPDGPAAAHWEERTHSQSHQWGQEAGELAETISKTQKEGTRIPGETSPVSWLSQHPLQAAQVCRSRGLERQQQKKPQQQRQQQRRCLCAAAALWLRRPFILWWTEAILHPALGSAKSAAAVSERDKGRERKRDRVSVCEREKET